jgi:hypothetical protein
MRAGDQAVGHIDEPIHLLGNNDMTSATIPELFIIESLRLEDERANRFEGGLISDMLHLAGKVGTRYYYLRTERELDEIIDEFDQSKCRYLHISCHANDQSMSTTFDTSISFDRLGSMLQSCLTGRRVFVSACGMANKNLADVLFAGTELSSLIGPASDMRFNDAAAFWVAFYHLMFRADHAKMRASELRRRTRQLGEVFGEQINYFTKSRVEGYSLVHLGKG